MKPKPLLSILLLTLTINLSFGQNPEPSEQKPLHPHFMSHFIEMRQLVGEDNIVHIDSLCGYKITIPKWWSIRESPRRSIFSGVFPKTKGIENALALKSNSKTEYKNFNDYKNFIIRKYNPGDHMLWSRYNEHKLLKRKKLDTFQTIGESYYVELEFRGKTYVCCYILAETKHTYLWIDFTATKETYHINIKKFKALMTNFQLIN